MPTELSWPPAHCRGSFFLRYGLFARNAHPGADQVWLYAVHHLQPPVLAGKYVINYLIFFGEQS